MLNDVSPPVYLPAQLLGSTSLPTSHYIIPISSHSHSLIQASTQTNDCFVNPFTDGILSATPVLSERQRVAQFERSQCRRNNLRVNGASVDIGSRSTGVEVLYDEDTGMGQSMPVSSVHALEIETGTTDDTCLNSKLNSEQYHFDAFPSTTFIRTHTELQTEDIFSFQKWSRPLSVDSPLNKVHQYRDNDFVHDGPSPEDVDHQLFSTSTVKLREAPVCLCSCRTFQTCQRRPSISSITLTSRRKQKLIIPSETDPITHSLSLVELHRSSPPTRSVLSFMHFWVSPKAHREPIHKCGFMEDPYCRKKELRFKLGLPSSKDAVHLTRNKQLTSHNSMPSITQASGITDVYTMNLTFDVNKVEGAMHGKTNMEHKRTRIGSIGDDGKVDEGQNLVSRLSKLTWLLHHQSLLSKAPKVKRGIKQKVIGNSMIHGVRELERSCGYLPELELVDAKSDNVAQSASWAWRLPINRKCPSASSHGVSWFIGTTRRPKTNDLSDPVLLVTSMRKRVHASLQESLRVSRPAFLSRSLSRQAKVAEHRDQRLGLKGKHGLLRRGRGGYTRTSWNVE